MANSLPAASKACIAGHFLNLHFLFLTPMVAISWMPLRGGILAIEGSQCMVVPEVGTTIRLCGSLHFRCYSILVYIRGILPSRCLFVPMGCIDLCHSWFLTILLLLRNWATQPRIASTIALQWRVQFPMPPSIAVGLDSYSALLRGTIQPDSGRCNLQRLEFQRHERC